MIIKGSIAETIHWLLVFVLLAMAIVFLRKRKIRKAGVAFLTCFSYVMVALLINSYLGKAYVIKSNFSCDVYYVWGSSHMNISGTDYTVDPYAGKIIVINTSTEEFKLTRVEYGNAHDGTWRDYSIEHSESKKIDISNIDVLPDMTAPPSVMLPPGEGLVQYKLYRVLR